jgi:hypothetical protein
MSATPAETRAARAFLFSHSKTGFGISPRKFAASAKELNVGFRELLRFIGTRYMAGQGEGARRREAVESAAKEE